jgi:HTH-type transcriptional regulator / antitoxin HipB
MGLLKKLIKYRIGKLNMPSISEKNISTPKNNSMARSQMKSYSLTEMEDKYVGKKGTVSRDKYEHELRMDVLGYMIKKARQERKLTQEQLGSLIGVQKAQISKLESSANSATIGTIFKVFKALKADIYFKVKLENQYLPLI